MDTLVSATSLPVLSVPGNHDHSSVRLIDTPGLNSITWPSTPPFHHTVGDIDVLGLNTAPASTGTNGVNTPRFCNGGPKATHRAVNLGGGRRLKSANLTGEAGSLGHLLSTQAQ